MRQKVTIVIPCYNEEAGIASVIKSVPKQKLSHAYQFDILVIDNNSTDNTAQAAKAAGARVIHESKQGKGNAIRTAFNSIDATTDYVVMLDGDNTYKADEVGRMLEPLHNNFSKVIIGSRLAGHMTEGSMRTFNRAGNWIYSHLVRYSYHVNVTDVLTGYFAWTREVIEDLRPHLESDGFAIEMEMITKMARLGHDIYSVPISYHARAGESSLNPVIDGLRILKMCTQNLRWSPKPTNKKPERYAAIQGSMSNNKD